MSGNAADRGGESVPLFVDTSALYARLDDDDAHHDRARALFDGIREQTVKRTYRPLYVTSHVLAEFVTLVVHNFGSPTAHDAADRIRRSDFFVVLYPDEPVVSQAIDALGEYADEEIVLVDHLTGILAAEQDIDHIMTFDSGFRTLGFTLVPEDIGDI